MSSRTTSQRHALAVAVGPSDPGFGRYVGFECDGLAL